MRMLPRTHPVFYKDITTGFYNDLCPTEECLCPDLTVCHMSNGGYDEQGFARIDDCKATYGVWLLGMIGKFESGYSACPSPVLAWTVMPNSRNLNVANASRIFARTVHALKFEQCQFGCWDRCEVVIKEKECLVKDRKIDWSQPRRLKATSSCAIDYTKEELLTKCG